VVVQGAPEQLKGELFGDAIHLELSQPEPAGRVRIALERVSDVRDLGFEGRCLRIRSQRGATAAPPILAALESEGIKVTSIRIARPSLDDVYLRYTGRSFSEADSGTAQ
jgi:ABC-2 type transport system ATP-binding protein